MAVIYDPPNADVDFVFIHGLNGGPLKTWTTDETCWPKDLLPANVPSARVITFGYDSQVVHFWSEPSQNRIDNHADALLTDLVAIRDRSGSNERPIIFVAHSLGGLVLAKALLLSRTGHVAIKSIAQCTRYIAFLGTPHAGSSKAAWGERGRKFIEYVGLQSNTELVRNLDSNSEVLASLGREFPAYLEDRLRKRQEIEVMCFFEGTNFRIVGKSIGKIVSEESACLSGKPRLSLYADHSAMCKFEGKDDENYVKVIGVLERWARAIRSPPVADEVGARTVNNVSADFSGSYNYALQTAQLNAPVNMSGWVSRSRSPFREDIYINLFATDNLTACERWAQTLSLARSKIMVNKMCEHDSSGSTNLLADVYENLQITGGLITVVNGRNGEDDCWTPVPSPSIFEKTLNLHVSLRIYCSKTAPTIMLPVE